MHHASTSSQFSMSIVGNGQRQSKKNENSFLFFFIALEVNRYQKKKFEIQKSHYDQDQTIIRYYFSDF